MESAELQILLDLSSAIASVRNRDELFKIIFEKINPVFNCAREAVVLIVDEEEKHYRLMLSEALSLSENEIAYYKSTRLPIDPVLRMILDSEMPLIFPVAPLIERHSEEIGSQIAKQLGIAEIISCRLQVSGRNIGSLSLHSNTIGLFQERHIPFYKAVSDIVAVAVSNILAHQEVQIREFQKSRLLQISSHIANIRDKDELFKIITEEIKKFIPFEDIVIAKVDEEKQTFNVFLSNMGEKTKEHEFYQQSLTQVHTLVKGTIPYKVYTSEKPFIIDVESEYAADPGGDYIRYAYEFGMKKELVARLVHSGKVIGLLAMLSKDYLYSEEDIEVFDTFSSLLAIALNNILADEAIRLREYQKAQLLNITAHIATVRDKNDLFHLIAEEIRAFIYFDDVVIALVDEEKQAFRVFLSDVAGTTSRHKNFQKAQTQLYPISKGSMAFKIFHSSDPVIVNIELEHLNNPEIDSMRFAYEFGMREQIVSRLLYSGKVIGMIGILSKKKNNYTHRDIETVRQLSNLMAIALNNILANEELKLRELQQAQFVNISAHIATVRDKSDLFHLIAKDVRSFIDYDDAVISAVNENSDSFTVFMADVGGTTSDHKDYKQAVTQVYPITETSVPYQIIRSEKPMIVDIKKEMFRNPDLEYLRHAYNFGFREEMLVRLSHSGKVIGVFILLSKSVGRFNEKDCETIASLSSLIAIALNNILANQEIENLSKQLEQDNIYLNEEIKNNYNFEEIIGESRPIQDVFQKVVQVAHVDSTVLILGETGTGKELIARAIHNLSSRKGRPLIKINCAALPAQLIESELFGHEKGSFTGATDKRIGKFELANGSTIFLDEIGELPLELQAKLLRVLQEKEIERIGGDKSIKVDVRIIAATNRNLEKEVAAGKFRSDLYYRLNIYPIELPALRDRKEDIPLLAVFFLRKLSHKLGKKITSIAPSVMDELVANDWPGNIRELEHTIERSMLLCNGKTITGLHISRPVIPEYLEATSLFSPKTLANNERDLILKTLKHTNGKVRGSGGAAELLDILPTTLEARMKKLGIRREYS